LRRFSAEWLGAALRLNSAMPGVFSELAYGRAGMKIKVVVHDAEEGGFWAEVPAIPDCATQGETMDELMRNLREASSPD
jgi:hypothetical protein